MRSNNGGRATFDTEMMNIKSKMKSGRAAERKTIGGDAKRKLKN